MVCDSHLFTKRGESKFLSNNLKTIPRHNIFSLSWSLHWSISITMCFPCKQCWEWKSLSSMISERSVKSLMIIYGGSRRQLPECSMINSGGETPPHGRITFWPRRKKKCEKFWREFYLKPLLLTLTGWGAAFYHLFLPVLFDNGLKHQGKTPHCNNNWNKKVESLKNLFSSYDKVIFFIFFSREFAFFPPRGFELSQLQGRS